MSNLFHVAEIAQAVLDVAYDGLAATSTGQPNDAYVSHNAPAVDCCFAGETEVVTSQGTQRLGDLEGQIVELMTTDGAWVKAPVRSFGQQQLWEIRLRRDGREKTIRTTSNHRWLLDPRIAATLSPRVLVEKTTEELIKGDALATEVGEAYEGILDLEGIRAGIVYGDGSRSGSKTRSSVQLYGVKRELASFFDHVIEREDCTYCGRLDGALKELPNPGRDLPYLAGWLAGYLATDGSVSGGTTRLGSASKEALDVVRDICYRLGIRTSLPISQLRKGYGEEPTLLWSVSLHPHPWLEALLIRSDQKRSFKPSTRTPSKWRVLSVKALDEVEEVFCASVPETRAFVLADHILTGNCDILVVYAEFIRPSIGMGFNAQYVTGGRVLNQCNDLGRVLDLVIELWRPCFPAVTDNAYNPFPAPEETDAAAKALLEDAWALQCALTGAACDGSIWPAGVARGCLDMAWGDMAPLGPKGGCAGWRWLLTFELDMSTCGS